MLDQTLQFFGLTTSPFTRPAKKPYLDPERKKALTQLHHLVQRRGFALVTGPSGSGKTAILHYLSNALSENHHQTTYVPFPFLEKTTCFNTSAPK
jgi:type II secretory pathway predicted ATPase ExeA